MSVTYQLLSFEPNAFAIECQLQQERSDNGQLSLNLAYCLTGDQSAIRYPEASISPGRQWHLWEHSCFECFIATAGRPDYYEVNLSPSGDWNSYYFTDVRKHMQEAHNLGITASDFSKDTRQARLSARLAFSHGSPDKYLEINLSAVIEGLNGDFHYFALAHALERPDFHCRKNFKRMDS